MTNPGTNPQGKGMFPDDPYGPIKNPKTNPAPDPRTVNGFHSRSDVDSAQSAQHHTIGIGHNQAASGDHVHDGSSSRKIGTGLNLAISGSKGGNAALASLITMLGNVIDFDDNTT
jgi:hypothetical protein